MRHIILISFLLFFNIKAIALESDYSKPVNIVSNEQEADLIANKIIFSKNVIVTQGSMKIQADKIEVHRLESGQLKSAIAYGKVVTFEQKLDNGKMINTRSSTLEYYPQSDLIVLKGNASIWQENSRLSGERIEYNIKSQKLKANNANTQGSRVSTTFVPSELKGQK